MSDPTGMPAGDDPIDPPADEPIDAPDDEPIDDAKRALRRAMRAMRRELSDRDERSTRLWSHVRGVPAVRAARTIMVFDSIPGEPATGPFIDWCRTTGKTVLLPEDEPPPEPERPDVVIVPGTAFTPDGHRLGQGGGWYDRFLPGVRSDCTTIGVGFAAQLVDELPFEPHDVALQIVVTDDGVATPGGRADGRLGERQSEAEAASTAGGADPTGSVGEAPSP